MTREIRFNAFDMNSVGPQSPGLRAHPRDAKDLDSWTGLTQTLERGVLDGVFIADLLGVYDVHMGGAHHAIQQGRQLPVDDPVQVAPAMATIDPPTKRRPAAARSVAPV